MSSSPENLMFSISASILQITREHDEMKKKVAVLESRNAELANTARLQDSKITELQEKVENLQEEVQDLTNSSSNPESTLKTSDIDPSVRKGVRGNFSLCFNFLTMSCRLFERFRE